MAAPYVRDMDQRTTDTRDEIYERIPWETLQRPAGGRQWIVYAVAGAVTLGALAYSFTRSQPVPPPETTAQVLPPASVAVPAPAEPAEQPESPVVIAEADLYAVDPERVIDQVAAHAEWFAVEYVAYDGTEASDATLRVLLPNGIPVPEAPDGTQVFVDWAGVSTIAETGPTSYRVEVLVRSLTSQAESGFARQPATLVTVDVAIDESGEPHVVSAPTLSVPQPAGSQSVDLVGVPDEVAAQVGDGYQILGGRVLEDGSWEVVALAASPDGVTRPVTVRVG